MPNIRLGAVVMLSLTMLSGCLAEGAACQPEGSAMCEEGKAVALFCENGTLQPYPCPGELGCSTNAQTKGVFCDFRGTAVGAFCPPNAVSEPDAGAAQTIGFCASSTALARCFKDTRRWSTTPCSSCTTVGTGVTCNP